MKTDQACGKCWFWQAVPETEVGKCRRYPPQMVVIQEVITPTSGSGKTGVLLGQKPHMAISIRGEYPVLSKADPGCGEFKCVDEREEGV